MHRLALAAALLLACPSHAGAQVLTSQYDNARTDATLNETTLTPANVNAAQFGKLRTIKVDGDVYAQPLYIPRVEIPGKGVHHVVYIATEHDSVYAFDADGQPAEPLWHVSFLKDGVSPVPAQDTKCPFISPEVGITPTPVIDLPTGTLYVLARTKEKTGLLTSRYVQKLHALAVNNGVEKFGGPVEIKASVNGTGGGSVGGGDAASSNDVLKDFAFDRGALPDAPVARGEQTFQNSGAGPVVSANGTRNSIVWLIETKVWNDYNSTKVSILHAYDAANVSRELYHSEQNSARDRAGPSVRFTIPTIASGRVYIGAKGEVDVYGLLGK